MKRALVVDDREENRHLLRSMLAEAGYSVATAGNGGEALAEARRNPPAVVISDVLMPQMDGFALCREWQRDPALRDIPFVFCTATDTSPDDEALAARLGAARFLVQPVEAHVLARTLDEVLEERARGRLQLPKPLPDEETSYYRLYNEVLIQRLEAKVLQLRREVAERRSAEIALEESRHRLRAILESEPECVKLITIDGTLLEMNPAGLAMIEADSPADVLGANMCELVVAEHRPAFTALNRRVFRGESGALEFEVVGLKGTRRWLETRAVPLRNSQGAIVALLGVTRDISEYRRTLAALQESEQRFRQLAESIHEVFWLTDATRARFLYVSPGYEATWGRTCESLYERPHEWLEAVHDEDRPRVQQARAAEASGHYDETFRIVRPDGSVRWIRDQAFPVRDDAGAVIRIAGIAEDVTERRILEAQLRQTQKMESIGQLAGGIAHDFNNLLTVIAGNGELLKAEFEAGSRGAGYATEVIQAAERAAALTQQLLSFSRRQALVMQVVDLNTVVTDAERLLRRLLGEDIRLTTRLDPGVRRVRADAASLAQVLMNLAVNARDAMPTGGELTITTSNAAIDPGSAPAHPDLAPGPYARLTVRDSGRGMTDLVRARAFEPFFTTKGVGKGTGLGLSVVHGIVKQSGGHIELSTQIDRGTEFQIYLPAADEPMTAVASEAREGELRGTETVLFVEDDAAVRRFGVFTLTAHGYTVLEASGGNSALELFGDAARPLDLLVTDVVMPELDGRQLAEALRQRYPGLKVLYTSGYTDDAVVRYGVLHADVPFLQKPYTARTLLGKIREALARQTG